jgi:hypothetical protein
MHRGLPCSDATNDADSRTPTSGSEPTDDSSSPEACSATSTPLKAGTTRVYNVLQHNAR